MVRVVRHYSSRSPMFLRYDDRGKLIAWALMGASRFGPVGKGRKSLEGIVARCSEMSAHEVDAAKLDARTFGLEV